MDSSGPPPEDSLESSSDWRETTEGTTYPSFSPSDFNFFDDGTRWGTPGVSPKNRIAIPSGHSPKHTLEGEFRSQPDLHAELDDVGYGAGLDHGWGDCYCFKCVGNGISGSQQPNEFGISSHSIGAGAANISNSFPNPNPAPNIQKGCNNSQNFLIRYSAHGLLNELPSLSVDAVSKVKPSRKRKARAPSPIEPIENAEIIVERLGKALRKDATCTSPTLIQELREIRKLYNFNDEPRSPSTQAAQTHSPAQSQSPAPRRGSRSEAPQNPPNLSSLPVFQPRATVSTIGGRLIPHHALNRGQSTSAASRARSIIYQCTYPNCSSGPWSGRTAKSDWKRHERSIHWNNQRWMCKECSTCRQLPQGLFACNFCHTPFPVVVVANQHTLQCEAARRNGKTFSRKDKLKEHLRTQHDLQEIGQQQSRWVYEVVSDWPRQCGFCGDILNDWNRRADHISIEFSKGAKISEWKIPFVPKSIDKKLDTLEHDSSGDEDDDDGDDQDHGLHNSMGGCVKSAFAASHITPRPNNFDLGRYLTNHQRYELIATSHTTTSPVTSPEDDIKKMGIKLRDIMARAPGIPSESQSMPQGIAVDYSLDSRRAQQNDKSNQAWQDESYKDTALSAVTFPPYTEKLYEFGDCSVGSCTTRPKPSHFDDSSSQNRHVK